MQVARLDSVSTIQSAGNGELQSVTPGSCMIWATVARILPAGTVNEGDWCNRFPCSAVLFVNEIIECGSAVTGIYNAGDTVLASFTFTLANTNLVDANIPVRLPGLQVGDKIFTNLHEHVAMGDKMQYTVYSYELLVK